MAEETPILKSSVNFDLSEKELVEVVEKAKDWAMMHGACMRLKSKFDSDSLFVSKITIDKKLKCKTKNFAE
jgi:glutathione synthase